MITNAVCARTLGTFSKGLLRVIEDNRGFATIAKNQDETKTLKEIKANEVIAITDTSHKYEHMEEMCIIEDDL